jgi:hypothetical protein
MSPLFRVSTWVRRGGAVLGVVGVCAGLSACYVVPVDPRVGHPAPSPVVVSPQAPAVALPLTFTARLYPANEQASGAGVVHATVTNDLQGRGVFTTTILGERFVGEATRKAGSTRDGLANGVGDRGGYLACQYTMNSATLGSGTCRLHTGAVFSLHLGG